MLSSVVIVLNTLRVWRFIHAIGNVDLGKIFFELAIIRQSHMHGLHHNNKVIWELNHLDCIGWRKAWREDENTIASVNSFSQH